jgi:hypothetical protein
MGNFLKFSFLSFGGLALMVGGMSSSSGSTKTLYCGYDNVQYEFVVKGTKVLNGTAFYEDFFINDVTDIYEEYWRREPLKLNSGYIPGKKLLKIYFEEVRDSKSHFGTIRVPTQKWKNDMAFNADGSGILMRDSNTQVNFRPFVKTDFECRISEN